MIAASILACAVNIAPVPPGKTNPVEAIIAVESGGDQFSLNINRWSGPQPRPHDAAEAARIAEGFIARGYSVDLGLMQVNNRNLPDLGLSIERVLEPCANVRAGTTILSGFYASAVRLYGEGQDALRHALSAYNTGSFVRGASYVARYYDHPIPALSVDLKVNATQAPRPAAPPVRGNPYTAPTQVYAREAMHVRVE